MAINLLDLNFYRQSNPDLAGFSDVDLTNHFFNFGLNEGRTFSRFVELSFYRSANPDLAGFADNSSLYDHLSNFGVQEGRRFSPFYSTSFYRQLNPDLAGFSNEGLFEHFQNFGIRETRKFSEFVDLDYYRGINTDLAGFDRLGLFDHLRNFGINDGRTFSPLISPRFYADANPDLPLGNDLNGAFRDIQLFGIAESRRFSPSISLETYRSLNTDLARANFDNFSLFNHLAIAGLGEGRSASLGYNSSFYRANNPDLQGFDNFSLFDHFQRFGLKEGRRTSDAFNSDFYLNNNPDLLNAGFNRSSGLFHYDSFGFRENRLASNIPIIPTSTPGASLNEAADLGTFTSRRSGSFSDGINPTNQIDTYRFTLPFTSTLNLDIQGLTAGIQATIIFDANGNGFAEPEEIVTSRSTNSATRISQLLTTGTYFLRIQGSETTNYTLNWAPVVATNINTFRDPGNFPAGALNFVFPQSLIQRTDSLGSSDRLDYYLVQLLDTRIRVNSFNGELRGELIRDANGNNFLDNEDPIEQMQVSSTQLSFRLPDNDLYWFRLSSVSPTTNTFYNIAIE
jgi:hypothetical protein